MLNYLHLELICIYYVGSFQFPSVWYFVTEKSITKQLCWSCYFLFSGPLLPARRRSLYVLATSMIIFLSKAYNIFPLLTSVKASFTKKVVGDYCFETILFSSIFPLVLHCPNFWLKNQSTFSCLVVLSYSKVVMNFFTFVFCFFFFVFMIIM